MNRQATAMTNEESHIFLVTLTYYISTVPLVCFFSHEIWYRPQTQVFSILLYPDQGNCQ